MDFDWEELSCWFIQSILIQILRDEHNAIDKPVPFPASARAALRRPSKGEDVMAAEHQKDYRGIVGRLLHMMAWSRPDIANAIA